MWQQQLIRITLKQKSLRQKLALSPYEYEYSVEGCSPVSLAVWNCPGSMNPVELATPPHRSPRVYVSELAVALLLTLLPLARQRTRGVPLSLVVHWTNISLEGSAQE